MVNVSMRCTDNLLCHPGDCVQVLGFVATVASSQPGVQAIVLTLLCLGYTVLHVVVAPMRSAQSNALQTALLVCLTTVALSGTPLGDALERAASMNDASTSSDSLATRLQLWFGVVAPACAVVVAYVAPAAAASWRKTVGRE